jgi:hypothetical protein
MGKRKPQKGDTEGNKYDKILKENLQRAMGSIVNSVVGIGFVTIKQLNLGNDKKMSVMKNVAKTISTFEP